MSRYQVATGRHHRINGASRRRWPAYNAEMEREIAATELWQAGRTGYYCAPSGRIVTQWPRSMSELEQALSSLDEDAYEVAPAFERQPRA